MTQIEKTPEPLLQDEPVRVLVVDDEKVIREILSDFLTMEGLVVRTAENGEVALAELQRNSYNLVVSDLKMPVMGGLELLEQINAHNINVLTVIMTGFGTVETAIEAMKKGAYDYVLKPFKVEEVVHIVKRGLERQRLQLENMRLKEAIGLYKTSAAISQSLSLDHILELVIDAAVEELNADLVSLQLAVPVIADEQPASSPAFVEKLRRGPTTTHGGGVVDLEELVACHRQNMPVLAHGSKTSRFVERSPNDAPLISFCSIPLQVRQQVIGIINAYSFSRGHRFSEGQRKMLAVLGSRAAVSIENAKLYENLLASNCNLEEANRSLEENFRQTIVGFVNALEETDRYTRGHSERVAVYSSMIAQGLGLSAQETDRVTLSAKIHDIGKIGIPSEKLNKPGRLTREETVNFRSHPEKGRRILEPIPFLRELIPGAYCHHENFDGSGYPQGLKGDEIPLMGRIITVADAYDAMTSDRAYRKALPHGTALQELEQGSGVQFDPEIVRVFLKALELHRQTARGAQTAFPAILAAGG